MTDWLLEPPVRLVCKPGCFGLEAFPRERRFHVSIDPATGSALDGHLFSVEGLRLVDEDGGDASRYAIGFACEHPDLKPGIGTLGGERRISFVREADASSAPSFPEGRISADARRLRVVLLTPGLFELGFRPTSIAGARVVACAVGRPDVISGWSFEKPAGPKPARRMAPAGSVYWVELSDGANAEDWARRVWMTCISDLAPRGHGKADQDRRDGFGLCLVGVA